MERNVEVDVTATIENELRKEIEELRAYNDMLKKEVEKHKSESLTNSVEAYRYKTAFEVLVAELKGGNR